MTCDQRVRLLKSVDKAERDLGSSFACIVVDGRLDVPPSQPPGNNSLIIHLMR